MTENTKSNRKQLNLGPYGKIPLDRLSEMEIETASGESIHIFQAKSTQSLGTWVYDSAACLAKYLETCLDVKTGVPLQNKRLIELGAGTGVVGLFAAHYGATTYITDLETLVPLLQYNVDMNQNKLKGSIKAKTLAWGENCNEFLPKFDYVVLANCIYYAGTFEPLLKTMLELCSEDTKVLACYEVRTPGIQNFVDQWHKHIERHFEVTYLPDHFICDKYKQDFIKLVEMEKKKIT